MNPTVQRMNPPRLFSTLRRRRLDRALSQEALARQAGISRQSYAAIETAVSVPSTDVALRLAAALDTSVEDLFRLPGNTPPVREVPWVGPRRTPPFPVRVARVGGTVRAYPLPAGAGHALSVPDGEGVSRQGGRVSVAVPPPPFAAASPGIDLVAAGCDPAFSLVADTLRAENGIHVLALPTGSLNALRLLGRGVIHLAGIHLGDDGAGDRNGAWVRRLVPFPCTRVGFAVWTLDLVLPRGNPAGIGGLEDIPGRGLRFVHRERGSATRALVDAHFNHLPDGGTPRRRSRATARSHLAVAEAVAGGWGDAGVAIRAAGRAFGLMGIPLVQERYDLVIPDHFLDLPAVDLLLRHLRSSRLRAGVELLGGYDTATMGEPA